MIATTISSSTNTPAASATGCFLKPSPELGPRRADFVARGGGLGRIGCHAHADLI